MKISWKSKIKFIYNNYCIWNNVVQKLGSNKLKSSLKPQISTYAQNHLIEKSLIEISWKTSPQMGTNII